MATNEKIQSVLESLRELDSAIDRVREIYVQTSEPIKEREYFSGTDENYPVKDSD